MALTSSKEAAAGGEIADMDMALSVEVDLSKGEF